MTQIIDHGKWQLYVPEIWPPYMPPNALFARRESDGVDWYDYVRAGTNFGADTVKFTALWQDTYSGYVTGAATRIAERLFPPNQLVREIIDYRGGDPQIELGNRLYDPDTNTFHDLPPLPDPMQPILDRLAAIEARLGITP